MSSRGSILVSRMRIQGNFGLSDPDLLGRRIFRGPSGCVLANWPGRVMPSSRSCDQAHRGLVWVQGVTPSLTAIPSLSSKVRRPPWNRDASLPGDGVGHGDRQVRGLAVRGARIRRHGELLEVEVQGRRRPPRGPFERRRGDRGPDRRGGRHGRPRDGRADGRVVWRPLTCWSTTRRPPTSCLTPTSTGLTSKVWDDILNVNLEGDVLRLPGGDALAPDVQRGGNIVNIASVAGVAGSGSSIAYAASKGAVITLTKSLARAFAPEVRVNRRRPRAGPDAMAGRSSGHDRVGHALHPWKRPATPDDVAGRVVLLLLADQTSLDDRAGPGGRWRSDDLRLVGTIGPGGVPRSRF